MTGQDTELKFMDFFLILWKRRGVVVGLTLLCALAAAVLAFVLPRKWDVDAVFGPSKFILQSETGKIEEKTFTDPKQIAVEINQRIYDAPIAEALQRNVRTLPLIKAENLRDTNLVRVSIRSGDVPGAEQMLALLTERLKKEGDQKADVEIAGTDAQIQDKGIEIKLLEGETKLTRDKLDILRRRAAGIEAEVAAGKKRLEALEARRQGGAAAPAGDELPLALRYQDTLNELITNIKVEEANLSFQTRSNEQVMERKANELALLKERRGRIDYAQVRKPPTATLSPVFPPRLALLAAGFLFGFLASVLLALFLEFIPKAKTA